MLSISPSVYVAWQSLAAHDLCGTVGSDFVSVTTLGFDRDELSTVRFGYNEGVYITAPLNYDELASDWIGGHCSGLNALTESHRAVLTSTVSGIAVYYYPCLPELVIPSGIATLNSVWASCRLEAQVWDPPSALVAVSNGMNAPPLSVPPKTTPMGGRPGPAPTALTPGNDGPVAPTFSTDSGIPTSVAAPGSAVPQNLPTITRLSVLSTPLQVVHPESTPLAFDPSVVATPIAQSLSDPSPIPAVNPSKPNSGDPSPGADPSSGVSVKTPNSGPLLSDSNGRPIPQHQIQTCPFPLRSPLW